MPESCDRIVFFDLETSSLHRVGQILNYCFVCVDSKWQELERISGEIKLSRLELPDPMAISATGINVVDLQANSDALSEFSALSKIHTFLKKWQGPKTGISGYNTESFDIPYLRTAFARNGLFPYLKLKSCDLMIMTQSLLARNDQLRSQYREFLKERQGIDSPRFSIRLELIASFFSLLNAPQSHESQDDVNVTIELAKLYHSRFQESIFYFEPYALFEMQKQNGDPIAVSTYKKQWEDPIGEDFFCFLRVEGGASYWVNLEEFRKWKSSSKEKSGTNRFPIRRFKHCEALRSAGTGKITADTSVIKLAQDAFNELKGFRVNDLYPPKDVYIEQWIYKLSAQDMTTLGNLINNTVQFDSIPEGSPNLNELKSLYRRFLLANADADRLQSHLYENFKRYANFRYQGKMRLYTQDEWEKPSDRPLEHLSFDQLMNLIPVAQKALKSDQLFDRKRSALAALKEYYEQSEIKAALNG